MSKLEARSALIIVATLVLALLVAIYIGPKPATVSHVPEQQDKPISASPYMIRSHATSVETREEVYNLASLMQLLVDDAYQGDTRRGTSIPLAFKGGILMGEKLKAYISSIGDDRKGMLIHNRLPERMMNYAHARHM